MNNKTRKLRDGIHIMRNYNPKTAIQYFIKHAYFSLFSDEGSTSVIIKGSLNQDTESPYRKAEMDKIMSDLFISNFNNNPDAYREFNNGIESFLQEEKKDPRYFEHLMKAQTANLIVKRG